MSEHFRPSYPVPNPVTRRMHRREVFWQITVPLVIGAILVLAAGAGVIYVGATNLGPVDRWASISIIWLIIPTMFVALIFLAVIASLAYGLVRLIGVLPKYTRQVQDLFVSIEARVKSAADSAVEPTLRVQGIIAGLRALRRR